METRSVRRRAPLATALTLLAAGCGHGAPVAAPISTPATTPTSATAPSTPIATPVGLRPDCSMMPRAALASLGRPLHPVTENYPGLQQPFLATCDFETPTNPYSLPQLQFTIISPGHYSVASVAAAEAKRPVGGLGDRAWSTRIEGACGVHWTHSDMLFDLGNLGNLGSGRTPDAWSCAELVRAARIVDESVFGS